MTPLRLGTRHQQGADGRSSEVEREDAVSRSEPGDLACRLQQACAENTDGREKQRQSKGLFASHRKRRVTFLRTGEGIRRSLTDAIND